MPTLQVARFGSSSCFIGGYIYAFCGDNGGNLSTIERLNYVDNPAEQATQVWELIPAENFSPNFVPTSFSLVTTLNDEEVVIMGG